MRSRSLTPSGSQVTSVVATPQRPPQTLHPLAASGAIKAFAREVCRNDVLNFGRLHFFFPDSRLALDLNTDRTLKEVLRVMGEQSKVSNVGS